MQPDQIIDELRHMRRLPVDAIRAADAKREVMVPIFLAEIEKFLEGKADDQQESNLLFFSFHMLGSWREKSAYRALLRMARHPDIYDVLGDATTEKLHRVVAAVFDGDPQPLYEAILDEHADQFVRSGLCEVLAIVTRSGEMTSTETMRFLRACYDDLKPTHDCFVWEGWQSAIAALGFVELKDLVRQAFEREYIDQTWLGFHHFEKDLAFAVEHPDLPPRASGRDFTLFGDTVEEFSKWYGFSAKCEREERRQERTAIRLNTGSGPMINHFRKVGRNDPCPCGSGKKFKKCCLNDSPFRVADDGAATAA